MKISLKELRGSLNCVRLIEEKGCYAEKALKEFLNENNQLISIFVTSIGTAKNNLAK